MRASTEAPRSWALADLERFVRPVYFGFTSSQVLIGVAAVTGNPEATKIASIIGVAVAFHLFAYVQNDVLDLPIDKTQPLRSEDPLVTGLIAPKTAMTLALAQIPLAAFLTYWAGGGVLAYLTLGVGFSFMTIYNLYGKRCPVPMITDAIQGISWGSLAIYGSLMIAGQLNFLSIVGATFGFGFLFLINGVHGGLRDLANDVAAGCTTTAVFFGARADQNGDVISTRGLRAFAFLALAVYMGPATYALLSGQFNYEGITLWLVIIAWIVLNAASVRILYLITQRKIEGRNQVIRSHGMPLLLPPVILFLPKMGLPMIVIMLCCFFVPFLIFDRQTKGHIRSIFRAGS